MPEQSIWGRAQTELLQNPVEEVAYLSQDLQINQHRLHGEAWALDVADGGLHREAWALDVADGDSCVKVNGNFPHANQADSFKTI